MLTTALAFLVTLGILIVVHEYGHYRVAVACGVKVLRFSVGFGRPIWRRIGRDGTEFVVSMLPLGGYVRMLDEREGPVASEERDRAFNRKPLWQRAAVVLAGPAANLLLAVALYAGIGWFGVQEVKPVVGLPISGSLADRSGLQAGDWVRSLRLDGADAIEVRSFQDLNWHLTRAALNGRRVTLEVTDPQGRRPAERVIDLTQFDAHQIDQRFLRTLGIDGPYSEAILARVLQGGAAEAAGLRDGDHVLAIDGTAVLDVSHLRQLIRRSASSVEPGGAVLVQRWQVDRAGQTMQVEVSPQVERVDGVAVGRIGAMIGGPVAMVQVRHGPVEGLGYAASRVWEVSTLSLQMLWKMLVGDASLRNLSGPITIADYAGQTARMGWAQYVAFLALVSVSLGVLNLLPLPMLDGGHLMYYLFEGLTGRPVSEVWLDRLQRGGLAILLLLMSLAIFNDVARLLGVH